MRARTASTTLSTSVVHKCAVALRRPAGCEIAEGHRVAQAIHGWDAVVPEASRLTTQHIGRSGADLLGSARPAVGVLATKAQGAGRQEREGDDVLEHRPVAVPA